MSDSFSAQDNVSLSLTYDRSASDGVGVVDGLPPPPPSQLFERVVTEAQLDTTDQAGAVLPPAPVVSPLKPKVRILAI